MKTKKVEPTHRRGVYLTLRARILAPYLLLALAVAVSMTLIGYNSVLKFLRQNDQQEIRDTVDHASLLLEKRLQQQVLEWHELAAALPAADVLLARWEASTANDFLLQNGEQTLWLRHNAARADDALPWAWVTEAAGAASPLTPVTGIHDVAGELAWYVVGPVSPANDAEAAGVLMISTSLAALARQVGEGVNAGITLYDPQGTLLATTHPDDANATLRLSPTTAAQFNAGSATQERPLTVANQPYTQILLPLRQTGENQVIVGLSLNRQPFIDDLNNARGTILLTLGMTVIATLVIGYAAAIRLVQPIVELMVASQEVASGSSDIRLNRLSQDEIGQLTQRFHSMVTQLRQRRALEDLFGRYVGDNIARRILDGEVELGGQRIWATALFADIRDFSAFTQKGDLGALLDELNEYYATMQRVIDAHGGVVNKFGGDSILALFGAPVICENHAEQAVTAAMSMMDELSKLNNQRLARGVAPIRIGIGVNTGEMIVGNLGSEKRREYTALGDSVNLAKRFSDLNKETPFDTVFAGEATLSDLARKLPLQVDDLGPVLVKGKVEPVRVYSLMHRTRLEQNAAKNNPNPCPLAAS